MTCFSYHMYSLYFMYPLSFSCNSFIFHICIYMFMALYLFSISLTYTCSFNLLFTSYIIFQCTFSAFNLISFHFTYHVYNKKCICTKLRWDLLLLMNVLFYVFDVNLIVCTIVFNCYRMNISYVEMNLSFLLSSWKY